MRLSPEPATNRCMSNCNPTSTGIGCRETGCARLSACRVVADTTAAIRRTPWDQAPCSENRRSIIIYHLTPCLLTYFLPRVRLARMLRGIAARRRFPKEELSAEDLVSAALQALGGSSVRNRGPLQYRQRPSPNQSSARILPVQERWAAVCFLPVVGRIPRRIWQQLLSQGRIPPTTEQSKADQSAIAIFPPGEESSDSTVGHWCAGGEDCADVAAALALSPADLSLTPRLTQTDG